MTFPSTPAATCSTTPASMPRTPSVSSSHSSDSLAELLSLPLLHADSYELSDWSQADPAGGLDLEAQMILSRAQRRRATLQQRAMDPVQRLRSSLHQTVTHMASEADDLRRDVSFYGSNHPGKIFEKAVIAVYFLGVFACLVEVGFVLASDFQQQSGGEVAAGGTALARATLTAAAVATASALPSALRRSSI